ncbi:GCN5-like N-acetyltransferase [Clostridium aceticum]|uniref:GCN5-like N-acetyltransferase n=1 Tax=Clostridium aceticum TaxID=84022 RepID=A0A0D8I8U7_9CLOT|nr:GNAT family N-acetyltransferase [Clostridium aceticum]AKL95734.1 GCN5-like N-acetyltransferase [Clostridium aceticum]KJF26715.1 hypothetical protein TZ02_10825 [Clostridium aceticum]
MEDNYTIRVATNKDLKDIMKIEFSCFKLEICEKEEVFLERIEIFNDGFYVVEKNDTVVGYISTEIWEYEEKIDSKWFDLGHSISQLHNPNGTELYISSMGLLPNYRGKGLGKEIFLKSTDLIVNKYNNIKSQILIVSEKWDSARKIYKQNNYIELMKIENFFKYKNNYKENGIVMRKHCI